MMESREYEVETLLGRPVVAPPASLDVPATVTPRHAYATFFHVFFKAISLLAYLLSTRFSDNFVLIFIACVLILAVDFWSVKNVTGRLLVGLRWWNDVREDGTNEWIFESSAGRKVHPKESTVFWYTLYGSMALWALCALSAIINLHFSWLLIVAVALALNAANLVGYWKCQKDAAKTARSRIEQVVNTGRVLRGVGLI